MQDEPSIDHADPFHFPLSIAVYCTRAPSWSPSFCSQHPAFNPSASPPPPPPPPKATPASSSLVAERRRPWLQRQDMRQRLARGRSRQRPVIALEYEPTLEPASPSGERVAKKPPRQNHNASATNHASPTRLGSHNSRGTIPFEACSRTLAVACAGRSATITETSQWPTRAALGGQPRSHRRCPRHGALQQRPDHP